MRRSGAKEENLLIQDVPIDGGHRRGKMMETGGFLLELGTVLPPALCWGEGIRDPSQDGVMGVKDLSQDGPVGLGQS